MAVTERMIATTSLTTSFNVSGKASTKAALQIRSVTSIQWYLSITGKIFSVAFLALGLVYASISSPSLSIDASPTVNPAIIPLHKISTIEMHQ